MRLVQDGCSEALRQSLDRPGLCSGNFLLHTIGNGKPGQGQKGGCASLLMQAGHGPQGKLLGWPAGPAQLALTFYCPGWRGVPLAPGPVCWVGVGGAGQHPQPGPGWMQHAQDVFVCLSVGVEHACRVRVSLGAPAAEG